MKKLCRNICRQKNTSLLVIFVGGVLYFGSVASDEQSRDYQPCVRDFLEMNRDNGPAKVDSNKETTIRLSGVMIGSPI
jgi:hypothetical protein